MPDHHKGLLEIDSQYIKANSVRMPECVFPLGTELEHVAPELLSGQPQWSHHTRWHPGYGKQKNP